MNKDTILQAISSEEIFLKFLKISDFPKGNISSPFTDDKKPICVLYKNGSFKCHSTGNQGDCFQLVAYLKNIDCKAIVLVTLSALNIKISHVRPQREKVIVWLLVMTQCTTCEVPFRMRDHCSCA